MQLEHKNVGNVVIVKPIGEITLGKGGDVLLKDRILSLLHEGHTQLVIDLGEVPHVDSAGLGQLVHALVTTKNRGGSLKLLKLTKRIHDLLVITRLATVFEVFEDEASAVASFGALA